MFEGDNFKRETVLEWDDVREFFIEAVANGDNTRFSARQRDAVATIRAANPSFHGSTIAEMVEWLEHGFTSDEIQGAESYVKDIHLPEQIWDEEGENVDVCAALSGDDEPFVEWEDLPSKPGIKVVAELAFLGVVQPNVIAEYGAWLAGMVANLEGEGVDVELDVAHPSGGSLIASDDRSKNQMIVRVKRAGEVRDFADYSALFSPSGFRLLGFSARVMACEAWGVTCSSGFGRSLDRRNWEVRWDATERTLYVLRPASPSHFPAEQMSAQLAEVMGD